MSNNTEQLNNLLSRLNSVTRKQEEFAKEINSLREEMLKITSASNQTDSVLQEKVALQDSEKRQEEPTNPVIVHEPVSSNQAFTYRPTTRPADYQREKVQNRNNINRNLEKIIGENLINKIGIAILILGVAIGTKYAIEHELISPLTRIIMGYLVGLILLGFAIKLKKNYDNFSAVLLSGAMAILYFITFAAYNFFELIPQALTFVLMVVFTLFTVIASLNYNKQIIAHIGLVGAYAVPFLLSDGSGKVAVLFTYMAIINIGILALAFRKYWKALNYMAFALTWIIFVSWYMSSYQVTSHFAIASIFLFVYFISFYITFLAYKLSQKEKFEWMDVILILANSFIFYGVGYALLDTYKNGSQMLGLFTLCNAVLHFVVSTIIYRQKLADRNLFYMVSGLVLVFIAIAIPVQLDGNWVTLLWAGEAALLFWIGRTRKVGVYEALSYAIMVLAFFSMFQDWIVNSNFISRHPVSTELPFINIQFLSSLLFIAAFGFIMQLDRNKKYPSAFVVREDILNVISTILPVILLLTIYVTIYHEITTGFDQAYLKSALPVNLHGYVIHDNSILSFKAVWLINYSLLFTSVLCIINIKRIKNDLLAMTTTLLSGLGVFIFLTVGLYFLSSLRDSYLRPTQNSYYLTSVFYMLIRYISFLFVALVFVTHSLYLKGSLVSINIKNAFPLFLHTTILWILSSELINWMDIAGSAVPYKLGITILWAVYSLAMIVLGIWKKNKNLRLAAIVLFGVTLAKLFLYDIASLNTIAKTIVLVLLGILLLIISFLYNKYKKIIFDENEN